MGKERVNGAGETVYPNDIGLDLSNIHPVGMVYPALGTDQQQLSHRHCLKRLRR